MREGKERGAGGRARATHGLSLLLPSPSPTLGNATDHVDPSAEMTATRTWAPVSDHWTSHLGATPSAASSTTAASRPPDAMAAPAGAAPPASGPAAASANSATSEWPTRIRSATEGAAFGSAASRARSAWRAVCQT